MHELASNIRKDLDSLSLAHSRRLAEIEGYGDMLSRDRLEVARGDLRSAVSGLETGDQTLLAETFQAIADRKAALGHPTESVRQALASLSTILEPQIRSVEMANTFWRVMLQMWEGLSEKTLDQKLAAEQALQQRATEQRHILDSVPAMVWYKDTENRILRLNRAAAATMGLTVAKVEGQSVYDLNPENADAYHQDDLEVIQSGQPKRGIIEPLATASGETRWLQTDKLPYLDDEGNIIGVIVFALDITERQNLIQQIEDSLERRGRQVRTSTEVAQEIASAPALDELYRRVVTLVKEQFGYYHAQLFLLNPAEDKLETVAGYGAVGAKFLEQSHFIPMGKGVVGRAGAMGLPVLSSDVSQDPEWIAHPLLPKTKGELAVPIKVQDLVLGVLDVQSDRTGALAEDDQLLLEGLCGQIAIAIESTRLREETETSLSELERLYQSVSREGWESYQQEAGTSGYLYDQAGVLPIEPQADQEGSILAPLSVRGQTFGALGIKPDPEAPLSPGEMALVESVAEQVSQALESARLFEQTQTALAETEHLYRASADMASAQSYEAVMAALRSHSLLGEADHSVNIYLFDHPWVDENPPERITSVERWSQIEQAGEMGHRVRDMQAIVQLLQGGKTITITDTHTDPQLDDHVRDLYASQLGARSVLIAPLAVGDQWLGYVDGLYTHPEVFPETEVRRLVALVTQASVTVQNLRQLELTQARAEREQLVRAIIDRVRRGSSREEIVKAALQEMAELLAATKAVFRLGDQAELLGSSQVSLEERLETGEHPTQDDSGLTPGYFVLNEQEGFAPDIWLPAMTEAVQSSSTVLQDAGAGANLALPVFLDNDLIGALGFGRNGGDSWNREDVQAAETIAEQIGWALEGQRLFDQERQARSLLGMRVDALDCLSDIGQKIGEAPRVPEFMGWVADRIPPAMQHPESCVAAIRFNGDIYGASEAFDLPVQIVQSLGTSGAEAGKVCIAYTQDLQFLDEESALLGDIARRLDGYIENRRLLRDAQASAEDQAALVHINEVVSQSLQLEDLLPAVLDIVIESLGVDAALVSLFDEDTASLNLAAARGLPEPMVCHLEENGLSDTLCEHVFETEETTAIPDVRQGAPVSVDAMIEMGFFAYTSVVISYQDQRQGTICCFGRTVREMSDRQLTLLKSIGAQLGVGAANARLYQREQARAEEQATLRRITEAVSGSLDAQTLMGTALGTMIADMGFDAALISLRDEKTDRLYLAAEQNLPAPLVRKFDESGLDDTLCDHVFRTAKSLSIDDVRDGAPVEVGGLVAQGLHGYMGALLTYGGESLGTICCFNRTVRRLSLAEQGILEAIGAQIGVGLANARLFEQEQVRAEEQATLRRITEAVSGSLDAQTLMDTALGTLISDMGFDAALISLSDEKTGSLYLAAEQDLPELLVQKFERQGLDDTLCDEVFKTGQSLSIDDIRKGAPVEVGGLVAQGLHGYMGALMTYGGERLGTICCFNRTVRRMSLSEQGILEAIGAQIGVGLANARLYQQEQVRAEEQATLRRITEAVSGSLDAQTLMDTALGTLISDMGFDAALISLRDEKTGSLYLAGEQNLPGPLASKFEKQGLDGTLCDHVFKAGQALSIDDVRRGAPVDVAGLVDQGLYGYMGALLTFGGENIGTICCFNRTVSRQSLAEQGILEAIGDQIGVGLANARLFEQEQVRAEEQATLRRITEAVSGSLDAQTLMDTALGTLITDMGFDAALISLNDEKSDRLYLAAEEKMPEVLVRKFEKVGLDDTLCDHVFRTGQAMSIDDIRRGAPVEVGGLVNQGLFGYMGALLTYGGESLGTICCFNRTVRRLTLDEQAILEAIGAQIGVGLANASLFEQEQVRAEEQATLRRITEAVGGSLDVQALLATALDTLITDMDFDAALVSLASEEDERLYLAAERGLPEAMVRKFEREGLGGTLCDYVFETGETACIDDVRLGAPVEVQGLIDQELYGYMGALLAYSGEKLGTVCCFTRTVRRMTVAEIALLEGVGGQLGVGVANARLFEETQSALAEVEAVHRSYLRQEWQAHLHQQAVLGQSGYLYDEAAGGRPDEPARVPDLWLPEMEQALEIGQASAVEGGEDGERAGLAMPITIRGETIGVLGVEAPSGNRHWTAEERALIEAVGEQLGQALESARLYSETRLRAEQELRVREITDEVRAALDLEELAQTAAEELAKTLGASHVAVHLRPAPSDDGTPANGGASDQNGLHRQGGTPAEGGAISD